MVDARISRYVDNKWQLLLISRIYGVGLVRIRIGRKKFVMLQYPHDVKNSQNILFCCDKVIVSLEESTFGDWAGSEHAPEKGFLEKLESIDGINTVETQTYTLMTL